MRIAGLPLDLWEYPAETITNRVFSGGPLAGLDRVFLPAAVAELLADPPLGPRTFVEDDNRGAILPDPIVELDGRPFFLSVKGVGSEVDPYSWRPLDRWYAAELTSDRALQARLRRRPPARGDRMITGELWLRGSPYGGQGLEHATTALRLSERADLTSLEGFRLAPILKVALLPPALEEELRSIHWYRTYPGRFVQELRLVPSNIRVYFHARTTLGTGVRHVFDEFGVDSNARATEFETNLLRSTVPLLTLFARTMERGAEGAEFRGLDFHDVWLDKDAVLAPDGTVFFVDLEGVEEVTVPRTGVREKLEDQVFRSLYEMTFACEQVEAERVRRFGGPEERRSRYGRLLRRALSQDRYVRVREDGPRLQLEVRNKADEPDLYLAFPALDP